MSFIRQLLGEIQKNPGATVDELAGALDMNAKRVRNQIHQATHQGWVDRQMDEVTRQPGYHLTKFGRDKLAQHDENKPGAGETKPGGSETKPGGSDDTAGPLERVLTLTDIIKQVRYVAGIEADVQLSAVPNGIREKLKALQDANYSQQQEMRDLRKEADRACAAFKAMKEQHAATEDALSASRNMNSAHRSCIGDIGKALGDPQLNTLEIIAKIAALRAAISTHAEASTGSATPLPEIADGQQREYLAVPTDQVAGYLVTAHRRKPRRINDEAPARRHAVAAVRNGAHRADVFALVPIATARRGAEWTDR